MEFAATPETAATKGVSQRVQPHGGALVNLVVTPERASELKELSGNLPDVDLTDRQLSDLELLSSGAFSPLTGYMGREDYESVLDSLRLADGTLWPLPVCLDLDQARAKALEPGKAVALRDAEGFMLGVLHVEDVWAVDKKREAEALYGTCDTRHPGVERLFSETGTHYVSGKVESIQLPLHFAFRGLRHTPLEIRALFAKLGWRRVVGFHTSHPLYRAQHESTLRAMTRAKANLLLHPAVGRVRPKDIDTYTRVRCYRELVRYYPPNMMVLSLFPYAERMAGARETLLCALVRKNYGCTHFLVGNDHERAGTDASGQPFCTAQSVEKLLEEVGEDLGIEVLPYERLVYVAEEGAYLPEAEVPEGAGRLTLSEDEFHERLRAGKPVPEWYSFPEVVREITRSNPPRHQQGLTIFCTGLSGAGKSTIAKVLYARFAELGRRPVTLLDGDIVRKNLSSELGFSREHRDINVRRIGFVASEITKNRGIAICAPIAPYAPTRNAVRKLIK
ncbi:MAG: sulfate adenylyltransferase [Deltaproteobacteria bacterium]|nr:sulfate adenylyltransferase [Deltaproteobacteria bacterium]